METADSTSTVRTSTPHGPNARTSIMEIACWVQPSRRYSPMVQTRESLIRKLLATDEQPSGRWCLTVQTMFLYRKDFQQNFLKNIVELLPVWTAQGHHPDSVRTKHCSHPYKNSKWIPLELREVRNSSKALFKCVVVVLQPKSILEVGSKIKGFHWRPLQVGEPGWEAFVLGYTSEIKIRPLHRVYVSVTVLYLALSSE